MIQITIFKKSENQFKGFQVIGHADSVKEGADLVCCSVSVLTINLVNSLESFTKEDFELIKEDGLGLIQVTFKNPIGEEAALLMKSYELGVQSISEEYDTWLKVIIKEV